ncbi:hypothetical protein OC861_000758 [Tilletia horrida]|nr:hypothetical protein OC861_000758 [Tilletia horrida]
MASIFVSGIPFGARERDLRKKIGSTIAKVCKRAKISPWPRFHVELWSKSGAGKGQVILPSKHVAELVLGHFKKYPVRLNGKPLRTQWGRDPPDPMRVKTLTDAVPQADAVSDYDSDDGTGGEVDTSHFDQVAFSWLTCGVWRVDGSYAEACSFVPSSTSHQAQVEPPVMRIEHDNAFLHIDLDHRKVRISLYDIVDYVIDGLPPGRCYISLRSLPMFLEHSYTPANTGGSPAFSDDFDTGWPNSRRTHVQLKRISALSPSHQHASPFCWVYSIEGCDMAECMRFFRRNATRLGEPTRMRPLRNTGPAPFSFKEFPTLWAWIDTLEFSLAFQLEALLYNRYILPEELHQLKHNIQLLSKEHGQKAVAQAVKDLCPSIPYRDAFEGHDISSRCDVEEIKRRLLRHFRSSSPLRLVRGKHSPGIEVHAVTVTPTGYYYEGPNVDPGNRIIRQYPGHEENYLRVRFADETQNRMFFDSKIDSRTHILQGRFKQILDHGIVVGGRHFKFLAFSSSALREHSTWFVCASFWADGNLVTADTIRRGVGDLKHIRCPPTWAARLGQSLTTTHTTLRVPVGVVKEDLPDIKRNGHCFSDGVGTLSSAVVRDLTGNSSKSLKNGPVVFQIRLGGAKGVLALDSRLPGYVIRLRPSQVKYRYPSHTKELSLEVAMACTSPLPFYLNRPMIALLESLGVPASAFLDLQRKAVTSLKKALTFPQDAAQILAQYGLGQATKLDQILKGLDGPLMSPRRLNALKDVPFLRACMIAAITYALRAIKYRCRIPVPKSCTLMGIMDETGKLEEGQIYVCLRPNGKRQVLQGLCLVARSPMMHPGDAQLANAIGEVKQDHPLRALHNCVVFSSKGTRPLPTMLAGGDLDGDLYNVSQYQPILPTRIFYSGDYPIVKPITLDSDQLSRIATMHLVQADRSPVGVLDRTCVELSELHSTAVDMAKTGIKPNLSSLSTFVDTKTKPDFMQKEFRLEPDVPDFTLAQTGSQRKSRRARYSRETVGFYRSTKALGQLFRQIDVSADVANWQRQARLVNNQNSVHAWGDRIREALSQYLDYGEVDLWTRRTDPAHRDLLDEYYIELDSIARDYAPEGRSDYLTEEEIFVSAVLGRGPYMQHNRNFDVVNSLRSYYRALIKRVLDVVITGDSRAGSVTGTGTTGSQNRSSTTSGVRTQASRASTVKDIFEDDSDDDELATQAGEWGDIADPAEHDASSDFSADLHPAERFERLATFFVSTVNYQASKPDRRSAPWIVMPELLKSMQELDSGII